MPKMQRNPQTTTRRILPLFLGMLLLSCTGLAHDPEFSEATPFLKHRPSLRFQFRSPIGESDMRLENLDPERKAEEEAYREFVLRAPIPPRVSIWLGFAAWGAGLGCWATGLLGLFSTRRRFGKLAIAVNLTLPTLFAMGLFGLYHNDIVSLSTASLLSIGSTLGIAGIGLWLSVTKQQD